MGLGRQRSRRTPSLGDRIVINSRRSGRVIANERLALLLRGVVLLIVWWAEVHSFKRAATRCQVSKGSKKVFVGADPQLIDYAWSYPSRSRTLRRLTVLVTDLYARKSWRAVMSAHRHDLSTIVWLGDLLDAGRTFDDEADYSRHAHRWHSVFPSPLGQAQSTKRRVPTIIIPGNHDMSIYDGTGKSHFEHHFGPTHAVLEVGTWQLVAIDSVSLVAGSKDEQEWIQSLPDSGKPRVLMTHVPLYRPEGTDCGPKRESKRPIRQGEGIGYQNEMSREDSEWLLRSIPNLKLVMSGDDHDYCRVVHRYEGMEEVPETTVKAFSMAMGVRKPGYELLGLTDDATIPIQATCILPDQIGIWLQVYLPAASILFLSLVFPRLYRVAHARATTARSNGLPVVHKHKRSLSSQLLFDVSSSVDALASGAEDEDGDDERDPHVAPLAYYSPADTGVAYHAPIESDGMPSPAKEAAGARRSRLWMWDRDDDLFDIEASKMRRVSGSTRRAPRRLMRAVRTVGAPINAVRLRLRGGILYEATAEFASIAWPGVALWISQAIYYLLW